MYLDASAREVGPTARALLFGGLVTGGLTMRRTRKFKIDYQTWGVTEEDGRIRPPLPTYLPAWGWLVVGLAFWWLVVPGAFWLVARLWR